MSEARLHPAVPGPVDREAFDDAQRRHRRRSWIYTLLGAVAVVLMGIPLAAVVSPLIYAVGVLVVDIVNFAVEIPDPLRALSESDSTTASSDPEVTPAFVAVIVLALLVPGTVVLFLAWLGVRAMFGRSGVGGGLLLLGGRDPEPGNLEERQLVNVAAEMAIAAGVPPPRVKLLDHATPNAAIIGPSMERATVVATTGLLEKLDRAETQAVIGHLVGGAGNGDLRIGMTIASLFQTLGVVSIFLSAPTEKPARRSLWRLMRFAFRRRGATDADAAEVADMLAAFEPLSESDPNQKTGFVQVLTLPFLMASGSFMMTRMIFGFLLVNPFIKRGWRARRYLADASAVELTRNPDALATGLVKLGQLGGPIAGAGWASHLFVVAPGADTTAPPVAEFQPPLGARIERVQALGGDPGHEWAPMPGQWTKGAVIAMIVLSPLWLAMAAVLIGCALVLTGISFAIDMLWLGLVFAPVHAVLRSLAS